MDCDAHFEIIMSPGDNEKFADALAEDFSSLREKVCNINVRNASTVVPADKQYIENEIEGKLGGFPSVDTSVIGALQEWMAKTGYAALETRQREKKATNSLRKQLADLLQQQGKFVEAEAQYRESFEAFQDSRDRFPLLTSIANCLRQRSMLEEAEKLDREALAGLRNIGERGDDYYKAVTSLANTLLKREKFAEAGPLYEEALAGRRSLIPAKPALVLGSLDNVAVLKFEMGLYEEAELLFRESLKGKRELHGDEDPKTLTTMNNLALSLSDEMKFEEAVQLLQAALAGKRKHQGVFHLETLTTMNNLGITYRRKGELREAEKYFRYVLELRRKGQRDGNFDAFTTAKDLARCYVELAATDATALDKAESHAQEALDGFRAVLKTEDTKHYYDALLTMGLILAKRGRLDEAEAHLLRARAGLQRKSGHTKRETIDAVRAVDDFRRRRSACSTLSSLSTMSPKASSSHRGDAAHA